MSLLPSIEPPDDFERSAYVRAAIGGLPPVAPPADFEDAVLRTVHRPRLTANHVVVIVAALSILGGIIWWTGSDPAPAPSTPVPTATVTTAPDTAVPAPVVAPASDSLKPTPPPKPRPKRSARPKQPVAGY
jgi:hypothetical protein